MPCVCPAHAGARVHIGLRFPPRRCGWLVGEPAGARAGGVVQRCPARSGGFFACTILDLQGLRRLAEASVRGHAARGGSGVLAPGAGSAVAGVQLPLRLSAPFHAAVSGANSRVSCRLCNRGRCARSRAGRAGDGQQPAARGVWRGGGAALWSAGDHGGLVGFGANSSCAGALGGHVLQLPTAADRSGSGAQLPRLLAVGGHHGACGLRPPGRALRGHGARATARPRGQSQSPLRHHVHLPQ